MRFVDVLLELRRKEELQRRGPYTSWRRFNFGGDPNNDVVIKSPYEFVEIYKILDGVNDVEVSPCPEKRWNLSMKWDARSLKLFVDESLATPQQLNAKLQFAKGSAQASFSRAAVEWLVGTVNLTTLLDQINSMTLPDFDYGLADCVHELIFNRTFLAQVDHPLNLSYYRNAVHRLFRFWRGPLSWCHVVIFPYRVLDQAKQLGARRSGLEGERDQFEYFARRLLFALESKLTPAVLQVQRESLRALWEASLRFLPRSTSQRR
ncbi:unnamed protein product [Heligmosomoides polygyrus]|uniref:Uncharacterized protein n=1 Tax=Heligmosomoides polygyrus TaxID=6339 RepID=A0A183FN63_HELPZ|nr:unnamed protein product [Heligmosomoides polygyrus]